jgi:hypothetical protein
MAVYDPPPVTPSFWLQVIATLALSAVIMLPVSYLLLDRIVPSIERRWRWVRWMGGDGP